MKEGTHIVFICSRLDLPGGTEHAVVRTASLFSEHGHKVTILVLDKSKESFFPVDPLVNLIHKELHFGITPKGNMVSRKVAFWRQTGQLKDLLTGLNPDVVIATEYHYSIVTRVATGKIACRVYSWEHHHFGELEKNRFWDYLFRKFYPGLDAVICLNPSEAKLFSSIGAKTEVIPNFINVHDREEKHEKKIITVARLSQVKGIDRLLQVAALVLKKHPEWQWQIIGDGELKPEVEKFIEDEKLIQQLILRPPVNHDLSPVYSSSGFYVMTSRNECFPMVLLEAMSYGKPCIAFDCETGPRHIIQNGIDGILVPDGEIGLMAQAIDDLINNKEKTIMMGKAAKQNMERFSPGKIYSLWEALVKREN